jgi:hypothetical protein
MPAFSADTVTFDTIFTTIGSATLYFKVYNRSSRPLLISDIELAGGAASFFRLNIDGEPLSRVSNVKIPPDDSLFIFVAVTIDPNNTNNPILVRDSVVFNTNGKLQHIKLLAYGQDVHLIKRKFTATQTWEADKPYLIYDYLAVDTGEILTINAGCKIYFHRNASMVVYGTLRAEGTFENPVVFQNDRPEEFYDIIPGQWGTIYFDPVSHDNTLNHVLIMNPTAGIQIGYPTDYNIPDLTVSNSTILNVSFAGIYAFGADITCYNTVFANSAGPAVALLRGGKYRFWHCTFDNNGVPGASRTSPSIVLTNIFNNPELNPSSGEYEYVRYEGDLEQADFMNSIVTGNYPHELQFVYDPAAGFTYHFDHCILKAAEDSISQYPAANFSSVFLNEDPLFVNDTDRYHLDFSLDTLSPAKDSGDMQLLQTWPFLNEDFRGNLRNNDKGPDLGAFERKEE